MDALNASRTGTRADAGTRARYMGNDSIEERQSFNSKRFLSTPRRARRPCRMGNVSRNASSYSPNLFNSRDRRFPDASGLLVKPVDDPQLSSK